MPTCICRFAYECVSGRHVARQTDTLGKTDAFRFFLLTSFFFFCLRPLSLDSLLLACPRGSLPLFARLRQHNTCRACSTSLASLSPPDDDSRASLSPNLATVSLSGLSVAAHGRCCCCHSQLAYTPAASIDRTRNNSSSNNISSSSSS